MEHPTKRMVWVGLPHRLQKWALVLACLAVMDPHFQIEEPNQQLVDPQSLADLSEAEEKVEEIRTPSDGIGIYLVLDRSGSMREEVSLKHPGAGRQKWTRMDVLKQMTAQFVKGNPKLGLSGRRDDLIGLVAFARVGQVIAPLTLDHGYILKELSQLKSVERREEDGTAIGYAIYKTANLIEATSHFAKELKEEGKPAYDIKSNVIILVTDGFHYPSPLDKEHPLRGMDVITAGQYAASQGIRVYIVNIEPALSQPRFVAEMERLRQAAEVTGGELLIAGRQGTLADIYAYIDRMEKGVLPIERQELAQVSEKVQKKESPKSYRKVHLFPYLLFLSSLLVLGAWGLEWTLLRRLP